MAIEIYITSSDGTTTAKELVQTITWSGDYQQCARTLELSITSSPTDSNIPTIACELGNGVVLKVDDIELFNGFIFERQRDSGSSTINVTCYDRGIYLKRNEAVYQFINMTPEDITKRICVDFDIKVGSLAKTDVKINRNFVGATLYSIIETAYSLASKKTGEKYQVRFEGDALFVVQKQAKDYALLLEEGSNLMSYSASDSITSLINQVVIYDTNDIIVNTKPDDELIEKYGLLQSYVKQCDGEDSADEVKKMLEDNGVYQKITVENLGNTECISGNTVIIHEPKTGAHALFYIDSDTHTWKKGLYLNKLVVNLNKLMDEQEVGELIK